MNTASVEIIGSGVAGLCCAILFAERGCRVTVRSASIGMDASCCSWWAGGMLAPWCERESAEPPIVSLGIESIDFWKKYCPDLETKGSLVLASRRDLPDLEQFASRTSEFEKITPETIESLEPDLAGRFDAGLFFKQECHLNPRQALQQLLQQLESTKDVQLEFSTHVDTTDPSNNDVDWQIDCRGLAARDVLTDLRGVRGEMLILQTDQVTLNRPVRLLHPRFPLYIVPRPDHKFMVGATMLESDYRGEPTVRSIMELLSAAYSLHPAFAEANILEMGADARPAFTDNLPRLRRRGNTLYVNGLFRHGFLCAPAMAKRAVDFALDNIIDDELIDENRA